MTPNEFGHKIRATHAAANTEKQASYPMATALAALATKRAAEMEKEANRFMKLLGALGTAGKTVDQGAGKLLGGIGGIFSGGGRAARVVGTGAQAMGRSAQSAGSRLVENSARVPNRIMGTSAGGAVRDAGRLAGHATGALGATAGLAGRATKLVGEGAQGIGSGLNWLSNVPGLRTLAAAPVVAGGAMAAKPYVPSVGLQNPVDINLPGYQYRPGDVTFRNPIKVNWGQ